MTLKAHKAIAESWKVLRIMTKYNLIKRNFNVTESNKKRVTDITYLIFNDKRADLSTILDLYDRKVVTYQITKRNDIKIIIDTLNEAITIPKDVTGLIIHSDQGFQYISYEYKAICESNGILISMSKKDIPMESFRSILKKETLYNDYTITSLQKYIELDKERIYFYNTTRIKGKKQKRKTYTKRENELELRPKR